MLPQFAPQTGVGRTAVQAYAARAGAPAGMYVPRDITLAYRLTAAGLQELP